MNSKADMLLSGIIGALVNADQLAAQYAAETGVQIGPFFDPARLPRDPESEPAHETPIYDADGVSQPMGPYGLVMLQAVEAKRADIAAISPKHAQPDQLAVLYACTPGLAKLEKGSDTHWIVLTEISWASFGAFQTNPAEALLFNVYDRKPGDPAVLLPSDRLVRRYQDYVPGARALPRELNSGRACAARVLEEIRTKMDNDRIPETDAIDFSPARPRGR